MTREEIKKAMRDTKKEVVLKNLHKLLSLVEGYPEYEDCVGYAIEKLEQEPTTKNNLGVDAVSREAVHSMLENLPVTVEDKWFNWLQMACMRLAELPSVTPQEPKWIPVSERLPEDSGEYLVFVEYDNGEKFIDLGDIDCEGILKKWNYLPDYRVLAWQPLPKPYKAESEEPGNDRKPTKQT